MENEVILRCPHCGGKQHYIGPGWVNGYPVDCYECEICEFTEKDEPVNFDEFKVVLL